MQIILEEVDSAYYGDIILSPREMDAMKYGEMIDGFTIFKKKRYYIGVKLQGLWDDYEEKNNGSEEDC